MLPPVWFNLAVTSVWITCSTTQKLKQLVIRRIFKLTLINTPIDFFDLYDFRGFKSLKLTSSVSVPEWQSIGFTDKKLPDQILLVVTFKLQQDFLCLEILWCQCCQHCVEKTKVLWLFWVSKLLCRLWIKWHVNHFIISLLLYQPYKWPFRNKKIIKEHVLSNSSHVCTFW